MCDFQDVLTIAQDEGAFMNPNFKIGSSIVGGMGIFAGTRQTKDTIVLRIPNKCTYSIQSLLSWTKSLQSETKCFDEIIKAVLSIKNLDSETAIIRSYMWGLSVMISIAEVTNMRVTSLDKIEPYMRILRTTPVLNVDDLRDCPDHQVQIQVLEKRKVRQTYMKLADIVKDYLLFEMAFQIHQAVKSRVLEIPRAIGDEDDFETDVTLVPVLDFANHNFAYNAVFDVDRSTSEVVLRLTETVEAGQEIVISYSQEKVKNTFFRTYGFMPSGEGLYQWRISEIDCLLNEAKGTTNINYTAMAKWLRVIPQLTIVVDKEDNCLLDPLEFQIPVLMIPGLNYYQEWSLELSDIREEVPTGTNVAEWIKTLRQQEESHDIVYAGETAFGVTWKDAYVSIPNLLEQTGNVSDEAYESLMLSSLHVIKRAILNAISRDEQYMATAHSSELKRYFRIKHKYLEQIASLCG